MAKNDSTGKGVSANKNTGGCSKGGVGYGRDGGRGKGSGRK